MNHVLYESPKITVYQDYWEDCPYDELIDFVMAMKGSHQGAHPTPDTPDSYKQYCHDLFTRLGLPTARWRWWVNHMTPYDDKSRDWMPGFPHTHGWHGWTAVTYLSPPDRGGELLITQNQREILARFKPEPGWSVICDGQTEHGVTRVDGMSSRLGIIGTGYYE